MYIKFCDWTTFSSTEPVLAWNNNCSGYDFALQYVMPRIVIWGGFLRFFWILSDLVWILATVYLYFQIYSLELQKQEEKNEKQADVCKTFTSRPFRIPGTPAPNYKNWDKRRTVNSKVLLGLGWATGGRSMFYKHLFLYLLNMLNLKNVIL